MAQDREELRERVACIIRDHNGEIYEHCERGRPFDYAALADRILAALPRTGEQDSEQMSKVRGFFRSGAQCLPRTGEQVLPEGFVAVPRELVAFLLGESAYKGIWFGDTMDPHVPSPPRYWWREDLAAYRAMIQAQADHIGEANEKVQQGERE